MSKEPERKLFISGILYDAMKKFYLLALCLLLVVFGCAFNRSIHDKSALKWQCSGSICSAGIYKCDNNVYSNPGRMDEASVYINGTSGEVIARCGGNILPLNPDSCAKIDETCDYSKQADSVPEIVSANS